MVEIKFSAQVASARDKWLKLSADETLETVLEFLRSKYAEREHNRRLGNLTAKLGSLGEEWRTCHLTQQLKLRRY